MVSNYVPDSDDSDDSDEVANSSDRVVAALADRGLAKRGGLLSKLGLL